MLWIVMETFSSSGDGISPNTRSLQWEERNSLPFCLQPRPETISQLSRKWKTDAERIVRASGMKPSPAEASSPNKPGLPANTIIIRIYKHNTNQLVENDEDGDGENLFNWPHSWLSGKYFLTKFEKRRY